MRSIAGFPKCCAVLAGYNLDEFVGSDRPFNLSKLMVGSEGTLGVVLEAKINLVQLPAAKAVLAIQFAELLEALEATPLILRHRPSAIEVMDRFILDHTRQSAQLDALRSSFIEGEPGALLCVEMLWRSAGGPPAAAAGRGAGAARTRSRLSLPLRARSAGTGANLEPARSRPGPLDGDEGRCQVPLLRRGHRRGAREAARLHRKVSRAGSAPRHVGGRVCARIRRLPARPAGCESQDRGGRAEVRSDRQRGGGSRARVRRRVVGRAWRRPRAKPVHAEDVRPGAVRGVSHHQAHVRSPGDLQSGEDRRRASVDGEPPLWRRVHDPHARSRFSTTRSTAAWPAPSTCAAALAPAGRSSKARCARRTWPLRTRPIQPAAVRTSCVSRWRGG